MKRAAERRYLITACVAACAVFCIVLLNISLSSERALRSLHAQQDELNLLTGEYAALKGRVEAMEGKKSLMQVKGIVQAMDEVFLPLGLKQRIKSIKPTGAKEMRDAAEEEAEVQVERVDMNELVNILYRMENAPMALSIRKAALKASFENPAYLNAVLTVALVRPK